MSGLFSTPKMPEIKNTVTPTAVTDDSKNIADERRRFAQRRGRAANILTQDYRNAGMSSAAKKLLGE